MVGKKKGISLFAVILIVIISLHLATGVKDPEKASALTADVSKKSESGVIPPTPSLPVEDATTGEKMDEAPRAPAAGTDKITTEPEELTPKSKGDTEAKSFILEDAGNLKAANRSNRTNTPVCSKLAARMCVKNERCEWFRGNCVDKIETLGFDFDCPTFPLPVPRNLTELMRFFNIMWENPPSVGDQEMWLMFVLVTLVLLGVTYFWIFISCWSCRLFVYMIRSKFNKVKVQRPIKKKKKVLRKRKVKVSVGMKDGSKFPLKRESTSEEENKLSVSGENRSSTPDSTIPSDSGTGKPSRRSSGGQSLRKPRPKKRGSFPSFVGMTKEDLERPSSEFPGPSTSRAAADYYGKSTEEEWEDCQDTSTTPSDDSRKRGKIIVTTATIETMSQAGTGQDLDKKNEEQPGMEMSEVGDEQVKSQKKAVKSQTQSPRKNDDEDKIEVVGNGEIETKF